jgi:hypothetical protein
MKLHEQLLKDLKASAPKSAMLGLLLLIGLYFWVPPLVRAFGGPEPVPSVARTSGAVSPSVTTQLEANSVNGFRGLSASANANLASNKKPRDSAAMVKLLRESPLLQAASIEELPQRPFGIDAEQFPLPVLIVEDDEVVTPKAEVVENPKVVDRLDGLALKSTIVGSRRRAALINNRLYQEGQSVSWKGQQLKLSLVQRKSVTLTDGSREWQLALDEDSDFDGGRSE